jgi:hypothetical protein
MEDFGIILGQLVCGPKWQSSFGTPMHLKNMVILSLLNHEICCISLVNYNIQFGIIACSKCVMIASNVMTHAQLFLSTYLCTGLGLFLIRLLWILSSTSTNKTYYSQEQEMNLVVVMFMGHELNKVEHAKALAHPKTTS